MVELTLLSGRVREDGGGINTGKREHWRIFHGLGLTQLCWHSTFYNMNNTLVRQIWEMPTVPALQ